jgi:deoxyribodipyrimidine photo-lyase
MPARQRTSASPSANPSATLVWFRQDLRCFDNPAFAQAMASGQPVYALYILDQGPHDPHPLGGASKWWLHHSLARFQADLAQLNVPLIVQAGSAEPVLADLVDQLSISKVFWNRLYEPHAISRDARIKADLKARLIEVQSYNAQLLVEPFTLATKGGTPFKVFTRFWEAARAQLTIDPPLPLPRPQLGPNKISGDFPALADLHLLPVRPNWASGFETVWQPGEAGAQAALDRFIGSALPHYAAERDRPDRPSTSRLSAHLHFGEIGPRQVYRAVTAQIPDRNADKLLAELGWREFAHHLLYHFPDLSHKSLRPEFDHFPWEEDPPALTAWCKGLTGYPIVDAGMRELWATGWMHNRVRMVAASFLVKHLMVPWQRGAAWFWDTLVDADLANNAASWQWVAGSGADAAPYFRIFNPILQGEKFDPEGHYVRRWVPELRDMPNGFIHKPWEAPIPPAHYPPPIIDHGAARARALSAFAALPKTSK